MKCYLCYAGTLYPEFEPHPSLKTAKASFFESAMDLERYGQNSEASLHIAKSEEFIHEYPDYVLSLTKRGALKCVRT